MAPQLRTLKAPPLSTLGPDADAMSLPEAKKQFLAAHGATYGYNGWLDQHWWSEVGSRLGHQHYLDMTGAGLYTNSQITAIMQELTSSAFGNPHSRNPSSRRSTQEVEDARALVLEFFNADPEQYHVVFTKGATEGLKMVGEYFPWAFHNHSTQSGSTTAPDNSSLTRSISSTSSMSTGSDSSNAHDAADMPSTLGAHSPHSTPPSHFIYTQANHKSVLGIGAYARQHGSHLHCLTLEQMQDWLQNPGSPIPESYHRASNPKPCNNGMCTGFNRGAQGAAQQTASSSCCQADQGAAAAVAQSAQSGHASAAASGGGAATGAGVTAGASCCGVGVTHHLVAYPAKDNYEGRMYPLDWIKQVHSKSDEANKYLVVLDAAAHAASHVLDLSQVTPDFVTLSFYKIFGYPTGLGALLIHKSAAKHLRKVYFGGGSVDYCTAEDAWAVMSAAPAGLEDGTLGFLNIAALKHGFALMDRLGGIQAVESHVESLRFWTYQQLSSLHHSNGVPLLKMFGAHEHGHEHQGGIFQFQVLTANGDRLPGRLVEAAATAAGLHLRTGCNCNPGRCLPNLGITPEEERARAAEGHTGPVLVVMRPRALLHAASSASTASAATDISMGSGSGAHLPHAPDASAAGAGGFGRAAAAAAADVGGFGEAAAAAADVGGEHQLVPVPLPVGSVRASLGALSTFEDCYALVRFLGTTFKDFQVNDQEVLTGVKMVNVLDYTQHQVTVEARISTSTGMCPPQHEEAVSCGDFFVALGEDAGASWYYQI